MKESKSKILHIQAFQKLCVLLFILGTDWPKRNFAFHDRHAFFQFNRVGPYSESICGRMGVLCYSNTRIKSDYTVFINQQRNDIDLHDLCEIHHHLRYFHQCEMQRFTVCGWVVPIPVQQARNMRTRNQVGGKRHIEWRQRHGAIGDDFNCHAALTEQDHRTEYRIH